MLKRFRRFAAISRFWPKMAGLALSFGGTGLLLLALHLLYGDAAIVWPAVCAVSGIGTILLGVTAVAAGDEKEQRNYDERRLAG